MVNLVFRMTLVGCLEFGLAEFSAGSDSRPTAQVSKIEAVDVRRLRTRYASVIKANEREERSPSPPREERVGERRPKTCGVPVRWQTATAIIILKLKARKRSINGWAW